MSPRGSHCGRRSAGFAAASGLALFLAASPASAQRNNANPAVLPEEQWQAQLDLRMDALSKADEDFIKFDDEIRQLTAGGKASKIAPDFKKKHEEAKLARAYAMRDVESFLRRSQLKRRPLLADLYSQRASAARTPLERVANLDHAELVLREAAEFFNSQVKAGAVRVRDLKDKLDAKPNDTNAVNDYNRALTQNFTDRVLLIRARRALADLLVNQVIYPALDEYEIYNRLTATMRGTVAAIAEAVALYRKAREEYDDLSADVKTTEQRLLKDAQLDGYEQGMKVSLAWCSYYRAWLTTPDPKDADRKRDLDFAADTFQELGNARDIRDDLKVEAQLGYALASRERRELDGAVSGLAKLIAEPKLTNTKMQAMWELARTYSYMRRYEDGVRKCDELNKMADAVNKHNSNKDNANNQLGTMYVNIAPAMKLNLLFAWKNDKTLPGSDKAAELFRTEGERLSKQHYAWRVLVDSFVNRDLESKVRNLKSPTPEELKAVSIGDKLTLANRFVNSAEQDVALIYFDSVIKDPQFAKEPAPKRAEILFQVGALYYQLFEKEAAAKMGEAPPEHIIKALTFFQRVSKEAPDSEQAKLIDKEKVVSGLLGKIEKTFGKEKAKELLGGGDFKIDALRSIIAKNPTDPKIDNYRLALVAELEDASSAKTGAERAKMIDEMVQLLMAIKPGTINAVKSYLQATYLRMTEFLDEEKVMGPRLPAAKILVAVEALKKGADIALHGWAAVEPKPGAEQIETWREFAADYVINAAELLCRPQLTAKNGMKQAVDLVSTFEKEFAGGDKGKDWDSEEYRVRRLVLKITFYQGTGDTAKAKELVEEFLKSTSNPDRHLKRLFNQTRRMIEAKELEARNAPTTSARSKLEGEAGVLAGQLIALGEQMMGRMSAGDKAGPRGQEMRDLILEMQIKSGEEKNVLAAKDQAEKLIKANPTNNGLYQVLKCECLTKLALIAGDNNEKWTEAGVEWLKLTKDDKIRTNPEYIDFFWQAWWNALAVRLEQTRFAGSKVKIQEIKDAKKNLYGNFGGPTDKWKPYFDELEQAILDNASAYRKN